MLKYCKTERWLLQQITTTNNNWPANTIKSKETPLKKKKIFVQEDPKGIECQILRQDTCHPSEPHLVNISHIREAYKSILKAHKFPLKVLFHYSLLRVLQSFLEATSQCFCHIQIQLPHSHASTHVPNQLNCPRYSVDRSTIADWYSGQSSQF